MQQLWLKEEDTGRGFYGVRKTFRLEKKNSAACETIITEEASEEGSAIEGGN